MADGGATRALGVWLVLAVLAAAWGACEKAPTSTPLVEGSTAVGAATPDLAVAAESLPLEAQGSADAGAPQWFAFKGGAGQWVALGLVAAGDGESVVEVVADPEEAPVDFTRSARGAGGAGRTVCLPWAGLYYVAVSHTGAAARPYTLTVTPTSPPAAEAADLASPSTLQGALTEKPRVYRLAGWGGGSLRTVVTPVASLPAAAMWTRAQDGAVVAYASAVPAVLDLHLAAGDYQLVVDALGPASGAFELSLGGAP